MYSISKVTLVVNKNEGSRATRNEIRIRVRYRRSNARRRCAGEEWPGTGADGGFLRLRDALEARVSEGRVGVG